jgi:hypothetical protein
MNQHPEKLNSRKYMEKKRDHLDDPLKTEKITKIMERMLIFVDVYNKAISSFLLFLCFLL